MRNIIYKYHSLFIPQLCKLLGWVVRGIKLSNQEKNWAFEEKETVQILGNIGSKENQVREDERKNLKTNISDEQESYSKP